MMRPASSFRPIRSWWLPLCASVFLVACGSDPLDVCSYGGATYSPGASFPSSDGCNSCSCGPGGKVECTEKACLVDGGPPIGSPMADAGACTYGGKSYAEGANFPSSDGCNTCSCSGGGVACTRRACFPDAGPAQPDAAPAKPDAAADAGGGCRLGDKVYRAGEAFSDGCNSCACTVGGQIACTARFCPIDAGPLTCGVTGAYQYGATGGNAIWEGRSQLLGGAKYKYERVYLRNAPPIAPTCAPDLPACGTKDAVTPREVEAALADADVQKAFSSATPPLYGKDNRPVDGTVFAVKRASDGRSFLVGAECPANDRACPPIPAGVARLKQVLIALDQQQLALPVCVEALKAR